MGDPATKEMEQPATSAPTPEPVADAPAADPAPPAPDAPDVAPGQATASQHGDVLDI